MELNVWWKERDGVNEWLELEKKLFIHGAEYNGSENLTYNTEDKDIRTEGLSESSYQERECLIVLR